MEVAPRYDGPPIIALAHPALADVRTPFLRQSERMAETLAGLTEDQWLAPSRCAEWRALDVILHLATTNQFWQASIGAGLAGEPTRFLGDMGFDPKATPAALVAGDQGLDVDTAVRRWQKSSRALRELVAGLDDDGWQARAEGPAGHLPVTEIVNHALWDAWIHERDVLLPLGLTPVEEDDEVLACLGYAATLGPALLLGMGRPIPGGCVIEVHDPDARLVVETGEQVVLHDGAAPADAIVVRGRAVDVVEVLSVRSAPAGEGNGDVSESAATYAATLAEVFESDAFEVS